MADSIPDIKNSKFSTREKTHLSDNFDSDLVEKEIACQEIFCGKVFSVEMLDVILQDGSEGKREIVRHNGGATIVPLDHDNNVYMVRQFRAPFGRVILEIPAGKLELNEKPENCAERELTEETGLRADCIEKLGTIYPSPGYCSEELHLYLATGLHQGPANPDDGEFLQIVKEPITKLVAMIESGEICDAKTVAALLLTARRLSI